MEPSGSPPEEWLDVEPALCRASAELQVLQLTGALKCAGKSFCRGRSFLLGGCRSLQLHVAT